MVCHIVDPDEVQDLVGEVGTETRDECPVPGQPLKETLTPESDRVLQPLVSL